VRLLHPIVLMGVAVGTKAVNALLTSTVNVVSILWLLVFQKDLLAQGTAPVTINWAVCVMTTSMGFLVKMNFSTIVTTEDVRIPVPVIIMKDAPVRMAGWASFAKGQIYVTK